MNFDIEGLDKLQEGLKQLAQTGVNELNKGLDRINNPDAAGAKKAAVPDACPYCGAKLNTISEEPEIVCEYCGARFDNSSQRSIVDSVFDFVEKQQKIQQDEKQRKAERERERQIRKAAKKRGSRIRGFFVLMIIVIFLMYYYMYFC